MRPAVAEDLELLRVPSSRSAPAEHRAPPPPAGVVAERVEAPRRPSNRRLALLQFGLSTLALVIVLGTAGAFALRHIATTEALRDAEVLTQALGRAVVRDRITPQLLDGDPAAIAALDRAVRRRVLQDPIVRLKLWTPEGQIVYSDVPSLIGQRYQVSEDLRATFQQRRTHAEVTDLGQPENRFERDRGRLVEVYLPLRAADGRVVVAEAYHRADSIDSSAHRIWQSFLPVLVVLLVALALVQLPLAWVLTRRVRAQERARELLARRGEDALEAERRRIAAQLHNGVVQDLAGAAYELDAGAGRALTNPSGASAEDFAGVMRRSATLCRHSIVALRALLSDLFPSEPHDEDLGEAIEALARPLRRRGVEVHVEIAAADLPPDTSELLFRVVREALRAVDRHAGATSVRVAVHADADGVSLSVADDGRGLTAEHLHDKDADGSIGLALIAEGVAARGGSFLVESAPGAGTRISVSVPRR